MTKRVTTDDLSAYLDGELPELDMQRVRAELDADPEAARLLEELRSVDASVRRAPAEPPDAYFDALPGRIRARLPVAAQRSRWRPPVWGLAAAAALFAFVLTPLALRDRPSPLATPAPAAASKQLGGDATREVPPASSAPVAPAVGAPAREVGALARPEADALRDAEPAKRRDRVQALESKLQTRPTPAAELEERLASKDEPETARVKLKADVAAVEAQQGFAEPPRPAQAQEFGPRVTQQTAAPSRSPMKKEAAGAAAPTPSATRGPAGFADEGTVANRNATGRAAAAPVDFLSQAPATASEARSLREQARRFAEANPGDPRADLARVRVIELGTDAWRREGRGEDRDAARADAVAYLAREDARHKDRVRELLRGLTL